ncbi:S1C family serine protease [Microbacterium sp. SLBN-146]|uniref:S1C family serine protease n=1 Tax=Microbacterium sp. SLBN-146 TaxID=2768457 RepID=UPI00114F9C37|nr:trypsin-like peptidase domain-containing protein [Microbacterium sp. SLBN-146]TQJ31789.1 putative serine protease PepD [Microbacterium sp. SLBN-146]
MSENQGERPADEIPETPATEESPASAAQTPSPETPAAGTPTGAPAQVIPPQPPAPPVRTTPTAQTPDAPSSDAQAAAAQAPAPTTPPQAPAAQAPAWQPPHPTAAQGTVPPGYAGPGAAYARPQAYAGQPSAQNPSYAGQAPQGAAFGAVHSADAQPTLPLGDAPMTTAPKREKSGSAGKIVGLMVAAALVGGAAGLGGAYAGVNLFAPAPTSAAAGPSTVTVNDTESVNQTTGIATKALPSVVTIAAASSSGSGTGSGVVLTEDGYVVTNTHVVTLDGATGDASIRVTTSDGRVFDATVVGTDPTYDLAVIKLEGAEDLTPIEFADSSDLNVGDQTVAVGAPLGLANTVTTGIVSALNRSIEIASSAAPEGDAEEDGGESEQEDAPFFFDFGQGQQGSGSSAESIKIAVIQTDASINPGNSGGALVDADGALIGINVAIASAGGSSGSSGSIGVGFAIPSNVVERITSELIENGVATHGLLGASVQSAEFVEGASITGAYIAEVVSGGAAEAAGLEVGDIVTEFNGAPISDSVDLTAQVRAAAAGSDATLTFVRDGRSQTADVTLGSLS